MANHENPFCKNMRHLNWDDLHFFESVARNRTLTSTASELSVSIATVSRRIESLEQTLGTALFKRNYEGYVLTSEGERAFLYANKMGALVNALRDEITENDYPYTVTLYVPELIGHYVLLPELSEFIRQQPTISVDMRSSVNRFSILNHEPDIVLRLIPPATGNYTIKRVGKLRFGLYGSASYLDHSIIENTHDLRDHTLIGWPPDQSELVMHSWLINDFGLYPQVLLNSFNDQIQAVINGVGLAILPACIAEQHDLQEVLTEVPRMSQDMWMLTQEQVANNKSVLAVKNFIERSIKPLLEN